MSGKFWDNVYACFLVISDEYENFQLCSSSNLLIFTTHISQISHLVAMKTFHRQIQRKCWSFETLPLLRTLVHWYLKMNVPGSVISLSHTF